MAPERTIAVCCATMIGALYVVGVVSGTELRHVVQTLPIWIVVVLGWRGSKLTRWIALPFFLIWLALMVMIWLFLLGVSRMVSGHFTPAEVAMTIAIAVASAIGIGTAFRRQKRTSAGRAAAMFVFGAALQVAALRISFLPGIASR